MKARWATEEHRAKICAMFSGDGNPFYGKAHSTESREKMRKAATGRRLSEETKRKLSEMEKGRIFSEEHRRKISAAKSGENHHYFGKTLSAEHRQKLSETRKGRVRSEEHCRKISESKKGCKHPQWLGGISYQPYCEKFNSEFKERVREFWGRHCVECGCDESENGARLAVHHVNFRKDACCAEDVVPLFVPLCRSCHTRTNTNREYWESRFTALINEQYGGQCYLPKDDSK